LGDLKVADLRRSSRYIGQYVALRNRHADLLLTSEVGVEETEEWLRRTGDPVIVVTAGAELLGAAVLYLRRQGEVAFFARRPRRGIGSALLRALEGEARARGLGSIWGWALEDNAAARGAFEKCGFTPAGSSVRVFRGEERRGVRFVKAVASGAGEEVDPGNGSHETRDGAFGMRPGAKDFPLMCVLSLVYVCNARCPNCPYTNSDIREGYRDRPLMDGATFRLIAEQCGPHGAWIRISGGGEPMLHPQAVELMEYAKGAGARVGLITNGSRFTDESIRRLLEAGVDMIEFSVDAGDAGTYGRVRPGLKWEVLVRNVGRLVELRNRLGSPTKVIASGINQRGVDIDRVASFWEAVVDSFQKRKYLTWGINDPSRSADAAPYLPPEKRIPCPFIFERLNIDSRGKVMVCGFDIAAVTDMGNVHDRPIAEIWHGEGFERYRRMHLDRRGDELDLCRNCPDWQYRSWTHNYWKLVRKAEERRGGGLDFMDHEGSPAEETD